MPVFAHPGLADRDELIPGLIAAGIMGIECYYAEHSAAQRATYLQLCKEHDLVATGGSDFHGPRVRAASIGSPAVPIAAVDALRGKAAASRAALAPYVSDVRRSRKALDAAPHWADSTGRGAVRGTGGVPMTSVGRRSQDAL